MLHNLFWQTDNVMECMKQLENADSAMKKAVQEHRKTDAERLGLLYGMYQDNIDHLVFKAVFPGIIDLLNKYAGKAIGEKTKEKIRNEAKERFDCAVWYDRTSYSDILNIHYSPLNRLGFFADNVRSLSIEVYGKYMDASGERIKYFDGNKLNPLSVDMFHRDLPFHEDPEADVEKIFSLRNSIREHESIINALIDQYNDVFPAGRDKAQHVYTRVY